MSGHRRDLLLALGAAIGLPIVTVAGLISGSPSPSGPFVASLSVLTLTDLVGLASSDAGRQGMTTVVRRHKSDTSRVPVTMSGR